MATYSVAPRQKGPSSAGAAWVEPTGAQARPLYRAGALAALLSVGCIVVAIVVFATNPPPTTVADWFKQYHTNALIGLLDADLMMLVSYALMSVLYLALFHALRRAHEPFMTVALALGLVSVVSYVAANPAFGMLSLSNQYYAEAATAAERTQLLAAGQGMLANWTGSAFDVSYVLGGVTMLIIAMVMLRSMVFSRATAYVGLVVGAFGLVPATAGMVGVVASLISLLPTIIWLILIARGLFRLGGGSQGPGLTASPSEAVTSRAIRRRQLMVDAGIEPSHKGGHNEHGSHL